MGRIKERNGRDQHHFSELGRRIEAPPISWLMEQKLKYPDLISLAAGFTDGPSLPVKETAAIFKRIAASGKRAQEVLQYGVGAGRDQLCRITASRIAALDQMPADHPCYGVNRVVMTHGSQQFLYILSEALCDEDDIVLVEAPTYFVYLGILQSFGVRTRSIRMASDGLDLSHLKQTLESLKRRGQLGKLKFLYLVSYFQNPTGISTSQEKKQALLRLLRSYEKDAGHPIYILEDAAYRELKFPGGEEQASLLAMPKARDRVIYSGTYSKPFATGIRVGFGLLPEPLRSVVLRIKGNHDFGTSHLLQCILEEALESGLYASHLEQLQARYAKKAQHMCRAIRRFFPKEVRWDTPQGGLYVWAKAPDHVATGPQSALFKRALKERVLYVPGSYTYAEDLKDRKPDHAMRISFGNASLKHIQAGIERLGTALQRACATRKKGRPNGTPHGKS